MSKHKEVSQNPNPCHGGGPHGGLAHPSKSRKILKTFKRLSYLDPYRFRLLTVLFLLY